MNKCLVRTEIQNTLYIPRFNDDDTLDIELLKKVGIPEYWINDWQRMLEHSYTPEMLTKSAMYGFFSSNIDDDINKFLCDNKISKDDLHSIEILKKSSIYDNYTKAVIIYEVEKDE